jgi:hypothetical protein
VLALSLNSYLRTLELLFYCPRGSAKWSSSIFLQFWIIIICDLYFARLKPEKVNSKTKYRRSKILYRLGSTQMQQEIQKRVVKLSREQEEVLKEQTVVEQHLADDEIK